MSSEIQFQEVVSNSASEGEPLGTLAGRGINTSKKGGNVIIKVTEGEIENVTTYINPKEFTEIFAANELNNMDFWVQIGFRIQARRVMSAKQIPIM